MNIRPAKPHDAIARIIREAFGDELQRVPLYDDHITLVAEVAGEAAGFVDGFWTTAQDGTRRLELDLLAVRPNFRRRGIAKALIAAFTRQFPVVRVVVAADNARMHSALQRNGYRIVPDICHLYISEGLGNQQAIIPENAHFVPVETLTYTGVWLEGVVSSAAIVAAKRLYAGTVGVMIPVSQQGVLQVVQEAGFNKIGDYQFWWYRG